MGQPIDNDVFYFVGPIFVFQSFFWSFSCNSQQHLLIPTSSGFFPVFFFSRLFFTFAHEKLLSYLLVFVHINGISGCLPFLGAQLHFEDAPQGCSGSQAGRHFLAQYLSRHLPFSVFPLLTRSSVSLIPSGCQQHMK